MTDQKTLKQVVSQPTKQSNIKVVVDKTSPSGIRQVKDKPCR